MLIYTSCRSKRAGRERLFLRKVLQNLDNQRSNNTQTLKILEKKFFERRTKSRNSGRENSEAQKCAAKTNFNSKKEKQAKRVLTWTELKLSVMTDNTFLYGRYFL